MLQEVEKQAFNASVALTGIIFNQYFVGWLFTL